MKQVIAVRTDLRMGKGKIAAQVAHASLEAYKRALRERPEWVEAWEREGSKKVVLKVRSEKELLELYERAKREVPAALIRDAGYTQVDPGTITCAGFGPAPDDVMDRLFGHLKLL